MNSKGALEMLVAMVICGTIGITVSLSKQDEVSLIFFRCSIGALILLALCLWRGYLTRALLTSKLILGSLVGGAALLANWYFLFAAYDNTSIGVATTVYNTQPIMMIALGFLLFKERITGHVLGWVAVSLLGLIFISKVMGDNPTSAQEYDYFVGVMYALIAAALYAVASVFARLLKAYPAPLIALLQMLLGALVLWPFARFDVFNEHWPSVEAGATILLGVLHTGVMYVLLYGALQKIETWRAASIAFIYPAIAILIDALFLGVSLSTFQWLGMGLILLGAAGINLKWKFGLMFPQGVKTHV